MVTHDNPVTMKSCDTVSLLLQYHMMSHDVTVTVSRLSFLILVSSVGVVLVAGSQIWG